MACSINSTSRENFFKEHNCTRLLGKKASSVSYLDKHLFVTTLWGIHFKKYKYTLRVMKNKKAMSHNRNTWTVLVEQGLCFFSVWIKVFENMCSLYSTFYTFGHTVHGSWSIGMLLPKLSYFHAAIIITVHLINFFLLLHVWVVLPVVLLICTFITFLLILQRILYWGRILGRNPDKSLKSFPPYYSQSPLQPCL